MKPLFWKINGNSIDATNKSIPVTINDWHSTISEHLFPRTYNLYMLSKEIKKNSSDLGDKRNSRCQNLAESTK